MKKTLVQSNYNPFWWTVIALLILMFFAKQTLQATKIGQIDFSQIATLFLCGQFFSSLLYNVKKEKNLQLSKNLIQAHTWISIVATSLFICTCAVILTINAEGNNNIMMGILAVVSASILILTHLTIYSSLIFNRLLNIK